MSSSSIRSQLEQKRKQRLSEERKLSDARSKEAKKRGEASKSRDAANKTSSESTRRMRQRDSERHERDANAAAASAADSQRKIAGYSKDEARLSGRLADAEQSERRAADRRSAREAAAERQRLDRQESARADDLRREQLHVRSRLDEHSRDIEALRAPKVEPLRILMLTAAGEGDLRVGREQKRIHDAVRRANGRDSVQIDVRAAATAQDLLDGLTEFVPHVLHFSGHANDEELWLETDSDEPYLGVPVPSRVLHRALAAVDEPPLLIVLNACETAGQAQRLTAGAAPFAIGHADEIGDSDAIAYASRFYSAIANGQSILGAHETARVEMELVGLPDSELPQLFSAPGVDEAHVRLVLTDRKR